MVWTKKIKYFTVIFIIIFSIIIFFVFYPKKENPKIYKAFYINIPPNLKIVDNKIFPLLVNSDKINFENKFNIKLPDFNFNTETVLCSFNKKLHNIIYVESEESIISYVSKIYEANRIYIVSFDQKEYNVGVRIDGPTDDFDCIYKNPVEYSELKYSANAQK